MKEQDLIRSPQPQSGRTRKDSLESVWCDLLLWLQKDPDTNDRDLLARPRSDHPGRSTPRCGPCSTG